MGRRRSQRACASAPSMLSSSRGSPELRRRSASDADVSAVAEAATGSEAAPPGERGGGRTRGGGRDTAAAATSSSSTGEAEGAERRGDTPARKPDPEAGSMDHHQLGTGRYQVGRCSRENCKYLHPPTHLKTQLEINGRNNLIQQKTAAAMLAQQMQFMFPGTPLHPVPTFPVGPTIGTNTAISFAPYLAPVTPGVGLVPTEILPTTPVIVPGSPPVTVPGSTATQKLLRTDKLEVCREFQRGNCARGETDCRFAHPADSTMIDTNDNTVTVCMDYIKGRCMREKCKYFHPPAHLQAKIKAAQHQANQAAVAAQAAAAAATVMGFPPGALHPLPKRQALEKSNGGASTAFSPSVFHYQQALTSAQLQQQHAAFIPTDNSEIINRNGMECQESALRITKHCYCTYYPVSSSIELPQTAC